VFKFVIYFFIVFFILAISLYLFYTHLKTEKVLVKENEFIKSLSDDRQYRLIRLENGLDVTLVSDPQATASGASLSVGVGSFSDPKNIYGLAHFLEHMIFLVISF
jgi:insulysin